MKVIATKPGFHGGAMRNVGDEFEVADGAKASWFTSPDAGLKAAKPKALQHQRSMSIGIVLANSPVPVKDHVMFGSE